MANWRPGFDPDNLYFVTTTAVNRWRLFQLDTMKRLAVDTLDCMRLRGRFQLYCFAIMPNHLHLIVQCAADDPLSGCIRDMKRHIADRLLRHHHAERNQDVLERLAAAVRPADRQKHRVWEDGYVAKDVFSPAFLLQKMTYTHNNPCQPHWDLVERPEDYAWSSARFYLSDGPAIIPLDDAGHLLV